MSLSTSPINTGLPQDRIVPSTGNYSLIQDEALKELKKMQKKRAEKVEAGKENEFKFSNPFDSSDENMNPITTRRNIQSNSRESMGEPENLTQILDESIEANEKKNVQFFSYQFVFAKRTQFLSYLLLFIFMAVSSTIPLLWKSSQTIDSSDPSKKLKFYAFSSNSVYIMVAIFSTLIMMTVIKTIPFQGMTFMTIFKLSIARVLYCIPLCLEPYIYIDVSIAHTFVFGTFGLLVVAGLRYAVFRVNLTRTQILVLVLITMLVIAHEGKRIMPESRASVEEENSFSPSLIRGLILCLLQKTLNAVQGVVTEKVLKEDLRDFNIWQKLCAGSCIDIFMFFIIMFALDHDIILGSIGPFTGWTWLTAALVTAFIALTILIYNILDRLDAMYLSFSSFASKLISILFEYLFLKDAPFTLTKFMIEMTLLGTVIVYEFESMNEKYYNNIIRQWQGKNKVEKALLNIIQGTNFVKQTPREHAELVDAMFTEEFPIQIPDPNSHLVPLDTETTTVVVPVKTEELVDDTLWAQEYMFF